MGKKSLINLSQFKILASSSEKPVLQSRPHKLWLRGRTPHTRRLPQQFPDRVEVDLLLLLLFQNQTQDQFFYVFRFYDRVPVLGWVTKHRSDYELTEIARLVGELLFLN